MCDGEDDNEDEDDRRLIAVVALGSAATERAPAARVELVAAVLLLLLLPMFCRSCAAICACSCVSCGGDSSAAPPACTSADPVRVALSLSEGFAVVAIVVVAGWTSWPDEGRSAMKFLKRGPVTALCSVTCEGVICASSASLLAVALEPPRSAGGGRVPALISPGAMRLPSAMDREPLEVILACTLLIEGIFRTEKCRKGSSLGNNGLLGGPEFALPRSIPDGAV